MKKDINIITYLIKRGEKMPTSKKRVPKEREASVRVVKNPLKTKLGKVMVLILILGFVLGGVVALIYALITAMAA